MTDINPFYRIWNVRPNCIFSRNGNFCILRFFKIRINTNIPVRHCKFYGIVIPCSIRYLNELTTRICIINNDTFKDISIVRRCGHGNHLSCSCFCEIAYCTTFGNFIHIYIELLIRIINFYNQFNTEQSLCPTPVIIFFNPNVLII